MGGMTLRVGRPSGFGDPGGPVCAQPLQSELRWDPHHCTGSWGLAPAAHAAQPSTAAPGPQCCPCTWSRGACATRTAWAPRQPKWLFSGCARSMPLGRGFCCASASLPITLERLRVPMRTWESPNRRPFSSSPPFTLLTAMCPLHLKRTPG